jgi:NAD(P)-dependent dehydrogenase (short-subunit alcohol dehydrogenase family)
MNFFVAPLWTSAQYDPEAVESEPLRMIISARRRTPSRGGVVGARRSVHTLRMITSILIAAFALQAQQPVKQNVLITGSTDGLGREVARRVAATGAHVIIHGRNRERGQALVQEITREGKGSAAFYAADFSSLPEVRKFATTILRDYQRLDVLVNNAGILVPGNARQVSPDGNEMHFAVNYLAGFLLTRMLLPRLVESAPARIVNVSSAAQTPIDFDDPQMTRGYSGSRGYAQSKLAQVMLTVDLARELEGKGVIVTALHPATMMNTTMVIGAGMQPRSTVDQGATALFRLITAPDVQSGQYYNGLQPVRAHDQAYDENAREKLRTLSKLATGTM